MSAPVLDIQGLSVRLPGGGDRAFAIQDLSLTVQPGEIVCVVGESGSGKSVTAGAVMGLLPKILTPSAGRILLEGEDVLKVGPARLRQLRGSRMVMVFQEPMTALNPVLTVGDQLAEMLEAHSEKLGRQARRERVQALLADVHLPDPATLVKAYPHQLSGGQRQRVMIAIGIACRPKLLIADEATTALDVTVQAEIVALVQELKREIGMAIIWITHDLGVVAGISDTVQVMYAGRILERGPVDDIFADPRSAYTLGLLRSLPDLTRGRAGRGRLRQIEGAPPDMRHPSPGDPFAPRNAYATPRCRAEMPPLAQAPGAAPGHLVAAWYDLPQILAREAEAVA